VSGAWKWDKATRVRFYNDLGDLRTLASVDIHDNEAKGDQDPMEVEILMATVPTQAQVVVIGAGIVGNSLVHHLARLGWTDIVQLDQGPLPNPGGSTGHASNFIFLTDHSREITVTGGMPGRDRASARARTIS
jgi:hypothetical protein